MTVCPRRDPVDVSVGGPGTGHLAACWLHGPDDRLEAADRESLVREELAVADEA
jgi:hypothetical protein